MTGYRVQVIGVCKSRFGDVQLNYVDPEFKRRGKKNYVLLYNAYHLSDNRSAL